MPIDPLRVLIVDDSAFMRRMLREILQREPDLDVVGVAADGLEALEMVRALAPDIVTLDLIMPGLDGLGFLRAQQHRGAVPAIIVSILDEEDAHALTALELGAIDIVRKPGSVATTTVFDMAADLIEKIRIYARERYGLMISDAMQASPSGIPPSADVATTGHDTLAPLPRVAPLVLAIGTSTGGPLALRHILPKLPPDYPIPVVVAIHMPSGYTRSFAERLDRDCMLEVCEASQGDVLLPGRILIAPAGIHTRCEALEGGVCISLSAQPFDLPHRPSVDVLFESLAESYGAGTCAAVLTGMGADGALGARRIVEAGGRVFAQARASSIVYGMPRAVTEAGLAEAALELEEMAEFLCRLPYDEGGPRR